MKSASRIKYSTGWVPGSEFLTCSKFFHVTMKNSPALEHLLKVCAITFDDTLSDFVSGAAPEDKYAIRHPGNVAF